MRNGLILGVLLATLSLFSASSYSMADDVLPSNGSAASTHSVSLSDEGSYVTVSVTDSVGASVRVWSRMPSGGLTLMFTGTIDGSGTLMAVLPASSYVGSLPRYLVSTVIAGQDIRDWLE